MSGDSKYSVLFMRDDSRVKRFRMSPLWLKIFVYFLVFLIAFAALAAFLAVRFYNANTRLAKAVQEAETRLADTSVRLERLQRVQGILESYGKQDVETLLGTADEPSGQDGQAASRDEACNKTVSLSRIFKNIDTGQASVDDLDAVLTGRLLDITFNLSNLLPSEESISGRAVVKLVLDDGSEVVLPTDSEDMSYLIQRYKQVRTSAGLPSNVAPGSVFGLRLILQSSNGNVIFSELHPLETTQ